MDQQVPQVLPRCFVRGMANKVIPLRKARLKRDVLATVRRKLVLKAGQLEISVEINAEARLMRSATPSQTQSKVLPITRPTERIDDSRN